MAGPRDLVCASQDGRLQLHAVTRSRQDVDGPTRPDLDRRIHDRVLASLATDRNGA